MSLLEHAIRAVQQGFTIFPVAPGGKTPHRLRPDKPYTMRWSEVASNDLNQIIAWWTWSPHANIGVAAKPSGLMVIDCDMHQVPNGLADTPYAYLHEQYGPIVGGDDVLRAMCDRYSIDWDDLMDTFRVETGSQGVHVYTRWPSNIPASQSSPVPGYVDVRCNSGKGGYVLGAGSVTDKGPYVAENNLPIKPTHPALIELLREKPKPPPVPRVIVQPGAIQQPGRGGGGGEGNYDGLVNAVLYAAAGSVNATCHWAACVMAEDDAPVSLAEELLAPVYVTANGRGGYAQAVQTIRSGYKKVKGG